jgi:hypothetical protein
MPISISVNVDKVDKAKFFKGKKGRYLDLVLFETPDSEYGDYLVKQRGEKGEDLPILGNGKYFEPKPKKKPAKKARKQSDNEEDDDGEDNDW